MIPRKANLSDNHLIDDDSYKDSHWTQYPEGMTSQFAHFLSRGGIFPECTLALMQYFLHRYLSDPVTRDHVKEAKAFALAHGEPFNEEGWNYIVSKHDGRVPIRIRALPEGLVVPTSTPLYTVETTDDEINWIASFFETQLGRLWYPSTVAMGSREAKKIIKHYLDLTADNTEAEIGFKLHDFGGRGVTCREQAGVGGAAHLFNFLGSDTKQGVRLANHYYDCDMSAFSIPATEHSTVTSWGRDGEFRMVEQYIQRELIDRQLPPGVPKLAACVADSYDVYNFAHQVSTGRLKEMIKGSGGTFVLRPDSGDPVKVLMGILGTLSQNFGDEVRTNSKGFRVLPDYFRLIWGDGIDRNAIRRILESMYIWGWSASNIAFGSGGGLLQKWNRDDQKWKLACSSITCWTSRCSPQ
jgi:nicotinamide phosphoribosyltransferase